MTDRVQELVAIMQRLRQECPWDRRQTHESLRGYLLEETYELLEAIDTADQAALREELGDLLLQIVFHAHIARESHGWDLQDIALGISEKLVRRHPHVFEDHATAEDVEVNWHAMKAAEKGRTSITEGIPRELPALLRANKVEDRSAHLNLPAHSQQRAAERALADVADERALGALLYAIVAAARERGWDSEAALRQAIDRRIQEVRAVE